MRTMHSSLGSSKREAESNFFPTFFVRICKNAVMASIGEDDVFDEAIVTNYLKEVNMYDCISFLSFQ